MTVESVRIDKRNTMLLKLADFLEFTLPSEQFHFSSFGNKEPDCGCAIHHISKALGEGFNQVNSFSCTAWGAALRVVSDKLHLSDNEAKHLFLAGSQRVCLYGGKLLSSLATKEEVANNIREFVKISSAA